jgi:lysosomal alpha-glucosidase
MSRHGFIGTGQYASKWLGEYKSDWNNFRRFIVANLEMSMFGFSMVIYLLG